MARQHGVPLGADGRGDATKVVGQRAFLLLFVFLLFRLGVFLLVLALLFVLLAFDLLFDEVGQFGLLGALIGLATIIGAWTRVARIRVMLLVALGARARRDVRRGRPRVLNR